MSPRKAQQQHTRKKVIDRITPRQEDKNLKGQIDLSNNNNAMAAALQITALTHRIVELCEKSPDVSHEARALARQFQTSLALLLTPQAAAQASTLPAKAPEDWSSRARMRENPAEFVQRVYEPYLGKGLTRPHLKRLDPKLYESLKTFRTRSKALWPAELDVLLPTKHSANDEKIARAGLATGDLTPKDREFLRLYHVSRSRRRDLGD